MNCISLQEVSKINLMNRIDTKYIMSIQMLVSLLEKINTKYYVQDICGSRRLQYHTIYYDTNDMQMYNAHQEGRRVREKIRIRTYVNTGNVFLEVKNKTNKGRIIKHRIKIDNEKNIESEEMKNFLKKYAWYKIDEINQKLENDFRRITLVNKEKTERLTIDTDMQFHNIVTDKRTELANVAVVELKREGNVDSYLNTILENLHIKQSGFSKYCVGCALTDSNVNQDKIKIKLRKIAKINSLNAEYHVLN